MLRLILLSATLLAAAAQAVAADYMLDTAHTQARFAAKHFAISTVEGRIPVTAGTLSTGANDVPAAFSATLDLRKLNTEDDRRDSDLRSPDWFDVAKYPTMTFTSTQVTPGPDNTFTANGNLTFHGVTKPVTLTGKVEGKYADSRGRTHIGYSATGTIDRRQWNLLFNGANPAGNLVVSNEIEIRLNAEAVGKP